METLLAAITAMLLAAPVTFGAILTGQQAKLCDRIGGVYTPAPFQQNVCPGGSWAKLWTGR